MPNVYKLFLNITIQNVRLCFNNGLSSISMEFETDIDEIFGKINAYIPQFTTRSDTPTTRDEMLDIQGIFYCRLWIGFPLLLLQKLHLQEKCQENIALYPLLSMIFPSQHSFQ